MATVAPNHPLGGKIAVVLFTVVIIINGITLGGFVITVAVVVERKQPFFKRYGIMHAVTSRTAFRFRSGRIGKRCLMCQTPTVGSVDIQASLKTVAAR